MAIDFGERGLQFGTFLQLFDMLDRMCRWHKEADGSKFAKDIIGEAFDFDTKADVDGKGGTQAQLQAAADAISEEHEGLKEIIEALWTDSLNDDLIFTEDDLAADPFEVVYDANLIGQGQIVASGRTGFLAVFRASMIANAQRIKNNIITFGAITKLDSPTGEIVIGVAATGLFYVLDGTIILECTADTVEAIDFTVTQDITVPLVDGTVSFASANLLRVGQQFSDIEEIGISNIQIDLDTPVETGDTGNVFDNGTLVITNPTEATTDKGKFHVRVERLSGDVWDVSLFSDSSLTNKVGTSTEAVGLVGTTPITVSTADGTVAVTFNNVNAAVEMGTVGDIYTGVIFDVQIPRLESKWTITTSSDKAGNYATKISRVPGWRADVPVGVAESGGFDESRAVDLDLPSV